MTSKRAIAIGDTVYSQHGQEAELIAITGGEYIVRPVYEDDDGPRAGGVETWREVFRTPPAPKLDAETAAAEKRLADLQEEIRKARDARHDFDKDAEARKARIKQHEALADLDNYLAGKITHYVALSQYGRGVEILTVDQTMERYPSSYNYGLLTLYPHTHWSTGLQWTLNYKRHANDYGTSVRVFLCCGEEEAKVKAAEVLRGFIDEELAKKPGQRYAAETLINECRKHGVDVPAELVDEVEAAKRAQLAKELAEHQAKAAAIEKQLSTTTAN